MDARDAVDVREAGRIYSRAYILGPWILIVGAWSLILFAFSTNHALLIDHDYLLRESHFPWLVALAVFLLSWQIMTIAMMLPSSLSVISRIGSIHRVYRPLWTVQGIFIAGYSFVWTLFALVAFLGDTLIHQLLNHWWWLYTHSWVIGAAVLAIAGIFQLSLLKRHCLWQCCNNANLWRRYAHPGTRSLWFLGAHYGVYCLGSCWAIMLVMFGVGMRNLPWLAFLTVAMVIEKEFPGGSRLRVGIGGIFLLLAVLWLIFPLLH